MATHEVIINEEDKELLLPRVQEIVFVDGVAGFECRRCDRTLIRHYIADCGHKFCLNCKHLLEKSNSNCPLPSCKQPITNIDLQDVEFEWKLYDLRAHCPNKRYGCPFVSPLKDIGSHLRICKETKDGALPVLIKGNGVMEAMLRELSNKFDKLSLDVNNMKEDMKTEVEDKMRNIEIQVENSLKVMKTEIDKNMETMIDKNINKTEIDMKVAAFQLDFEKKIEAYSVEINRKIKTINKEFAVVNNKMMQQADNLKFEAINMTKKIDESKANVEGKVREFNIPLINKIDSQKSELNAKITKLENETEENKSLIKSNEKMNEKLFQLENFILLRNPEINTYNLVEEKCTLQPEFTWKINGIKKLVEQKTFEVKSEVFQWNGYPVQSRAKLEVKQDDQVWVSLCIEDVNNKKTKDINIIPTVYYLLRDQSVNNELKHRVRSMSYLFTSKFNNIPSFDYENALVHKSRFTDPPYSVNDSIVIDIYVEPYSISRKVLSYDGTLNWAIDNYYKRKQMAIELIVYCHESPYFYTGPKGYRVRVEIWLDDSGEFDGKGLTAQIIFVTGEFDDDLPRSFPHQTTLTLLNRKHPDQSISKTIEQDIKDKSGYLIDIGTNKEIENILDNDILYYNVCIR